MIRIQDLFDIRYGTDLELIRLKEVKDNGIPFVNCSSQNNGITAIVEHLPDMDPIQGGVLSCAMNGSILSCFLQKEPFYSGRDVYYLQSKQELSERHLLFYAYVIRKNGFRYNYARKANRTFKNILIPELSEIPAWLNEVDFKKIEKKINSAVENFHIPIDTSKWKSFQLRELFSIKKGVRLIKKNMTLGHTPFVGATDSNNGITAYIGQASIHKSNTISVSYNGSVGEAFYQTTPFWASDDVNVLYPKFKMTMELALFLTTIIRLEGKTKFSYVRKWNLDRMLATTIKIPVDEKNRPDWKAVRKIMAPVLKKTKSLQQSTVNSLSSTSCE